MESQENSTTQHIEQLNLIKPGRQVHLVEGQLRKIIHEQGQGEHPQKGQEVSALYRGTLQNGEEFDSNQDRDSPFKFTLGQGMVIKGWDEGFASMKKGEKATLICSPEYAYGKRGSPPKIPPNSILNFEVQLLGFEDKKKQKWQLSDEEKIIEATNFKNNGNEAFKTAAYKQAVKFYSNGLEYFDSQEATELRQVEKVLRLNIAQAQLKIGQYSQALKHCTKVLDKESNNVKALYRRGVAYLKSQQFENASADFESLLKIEPNNVEGQKELQNIKVAEKAYKQKQKKVFGNMFGKSD